MLVESWKEFEKSPHLTTPFIQEETEQKLPVYVCLKEFTKERATSLIMDVADL